MTEPPYGGHDPRRGPWDRWSAGSDPDATQVVPAAPADPAYDAPTTVQPTVREGYEPGYASAYDDAPTGVQPTAPYRTDQPQGPPPGGYDDRRPPLLPPRRPRKRRRGRRVLALLAGLLALLLLFYVGLAVWALSRLEKVDALQDYPGRPRDTAGQTSLLVGSDSREGLSREERRRLRTGSTEGRRTDTLLLLHVPSSGKPTLVSLPRDSYVDVPAFRDSAGRQRPAHKDKLNAAYSLGGAPLLTRTVEQATGLRLDSYTEIGFAGVVGITDAVGGVDLCLDRPIKDARAGLDVPAGCQVLDGPKSLGYVRARYSDPRGDLGRVDRQRRFLGALMGKVADPSTLLNPFSAARVARAGTEAVTVDEDTGALDLVRAARAMKRIPGGDGATTTVPIADPDLRTPVGRAVLWDDAGARELFRRLR